MKACVCGSRLAVHSAGLTTAQERLKVARTRPRARQRESVCGWRAAFRIFDRTFWFCVARRDRAQHTHKRNTDSTRDRRGRYLRVSVSWTRQRARLGRARLDLCG